MIETETVLLLLAFLVGTNIILAIILKAISERVGVPALVSYLILGAVMRSLDHQIHFLSPTILEVYGFLAELGIISLLFRVGLESNLAGLIRQLPRASFILVGDVVFCSALSFVTAIQWLQLELIPSLFISLALTATSVGISVSVWREAGVLNSTNGELLLDIAEMDDIAAIALMSLLFAIVPVLNGDVEDNFMAVLVPTIGSFVVKVCLFGLLCFLLFQYLERPMTRFFERLEPAPDPLLMVTATGIIIAALAGLMGFSVALGAFFAGLVFCRDPEAVNFDASFSTLYEFFVPFFFIQIGLQLEFLDFTSTLNIGLVFLVVAVLGKIIGTSVLALLRANRSSAMLLGISMVPRAEISLVIMERGRQLGDWAVPPQVFAAMIMVCATTCICSPLVLRPLLKKFSSTQE